MLNLHHKNLTGAKTEILKEFMRMNTSQTSLSGANPRA